MKQKGILIFFCGKMGAGKTTNAKMISAKRNAVYLSEDDWLAAHYPNQINTFDDFIRFSKLIKPFIKIYVQQILNTGTNVVMDFAANTKNQRKWFRQLFEEVQSNHELVFLDVSNEQCLAQIAKRKIEQPKRAQFDNEEVFNYVTQYFEAPMESEGFNIVIC